MKAVLKVAGMATALAVTFGLGFVSASAKPAEATTNTPPACLKYIDLSEQFIGLAAEGLGYASDGFTSIGNRDLYGADKANDKINALAPKVDRLANPLQSAKQDCRGGK
jgi:hypothetical protein